jgi:hypothetical protein
MYFPAAAQILLRIEKLGTWAMAWHLIVDGGVSGCGLCSLAQGPAPKGTARQCITSNRPKTARQTDTHFWLTGFRSFGPK